MKSLLLRCSRDQGNVIAVANHSWMPAQIQHPCVRGEDCCVSAWRQNFRGRHSHEHPPVDTDLRTQDLGQPWYASFEKFADGSDQDVFGPNYQFEPLEHFEPLVLRVFAQAKSL